MEEPESFQEVVEQLVNAPIKRLQLENIVEGSAPSNLQLILALHGSIASSLVALGAGLDHLRAHLLRIEARIEEADGR